LTNKPKQSDYSIIARVDYHYFAFSVSTDQDI